MSFRPPSSDAQCWALAHFLWEMHPKGLRAFIEQVEGDDRDGRAFRTHFGNEIDALDRQWRKYMDGL